VNSLLLAFYSFKLLLPAFAKLIRRVGEGSAPCGIVPQERQRKRKLEQQKIAIGEQKLKWSRTVVLFLLWRQTARQTERRETMYLDIYNL
jgi:hypothetical protein